MIVLVPALCAFIAAIVLYVFIVQVSAQVHINTIVGILVMVAIILLPMIGGLFVPQAIEASGTMLTTLSVFIGMMLGFVAAYFWATLTYHPL